MISTVVSFESFLPKPLILDDDDTIYTHRKGWAAKHIARSCSMVVCGNQRLTEMFSQWSPNIFVIPAGIDINQLRPIKKNNILEMCW